MGTHKRLIGLGAACFVFFVIAFFPARAAFSLLPGEISAFGVNGTLWSGSARIINVSGQQLRNTEWDLTLPRLLLGQLSGDFKTRWPGGFLEGTGSISVFGNISLGETTANFDAAMLTSAFNLPDLSGQVSVQLQELALDSLEEWPAVVIGKAEISNLSSALMGRGAAAEIGSVAITFDTSTETDENVINGVIEDVGGPIAATGNLTLTKPVSYELKVRIRARDEASAALKQNLEFLGPVMFDGTRIFELAGSI
jgi:hypothetical protein